MKILIVDDEQLAVQGILDGVNWQRLGFKEVLTAGNYPEAVRILKNTYIDILLSDIEMPGESGLQLIEYVNEHSAGTECVILTCHDEFDYAQTAVRLNCMEYVLKPIRYQRLTEILLRAKERVEQRRQGEQLKQYGERFVASLSKEAQGETVDALETATQHILEHLEDELSVRELAGLCYVSADHLTRLFKKKYGMTVSEYVQDKRLTLAAELLKQRELSISTISGMVGFGNYSYFTEQFKKRYGMTPRDYQKEHSGTA